MSEHEIDILKQRIAELEKLDAERRKAEEEVQAAKNKLQAIIHAIEDGVTIVDREYNITFQNKFLEDRFGGLGGKCYRVYEKKESICEGCPVEKAFADGKSHTAERKVVMLSGEQAWFENMANPLKDANGKIVACVELARNITNKKKADAEQGLYSEIMINMAEGVYIVGADDGIIKYCNPKFEKMFGYNPGEMAGKHVSTVNAPTDSGPKETAKEIMGILDKTGEWHGEVRNIKKDGTVFWCYANCSIFQHSVYGRVIVAVHSDITEGKKAGDKLKDNESLLRYAQQIVGLGFWDWNVTTDNLYWSDQTYIHYGFKPQEFVPTFEKFKSMVHPDDLTLVLRRVEGALQNNAEYNIEFRFVRPDGEIRYLYTRGEVTRDANGKAIRFVGSQIDISERKKGEEKNKQQRDFLEKTINSLRYPFYVIDLNYKILLANEFARNKGVIEGSSCYEVTRKLDKPCEGEHVCPLKEALRLKNTVKTEHILFDAKGNSAVVEVYGVPIFDEYGEMIQMIEYSIDITEQKKVQEEVKHAAEKWMETFDSISDLIFLQDKDFTITRVNKSFADAMKMKPGDIIGKKCYELLHKRNSPWPGCPFEKSKIDGKPHTEEVDDPNIGIPLLVTVSPVKDDKGEVAGAVHVVKDISEIRKARQELELKIRDLERFQKVVMGRESRIVELKEEVKKLKAELEKS